MARSRRIPIVGKKDYAESDDGEALTSGDGEIRASIFAGI
jgi:hypothetical protein